MGARDQIRQRFDELSPALQQVARYVLDHPNEVVTGSMRGIGTRAQSTVSYTHLTLPTILLV